MFQRIRIIIACTTCQFGSPAQSAEFKIVNPVGNPVVNPVVNNHVVNPVVNNHVVNPVVNNHVVNPVILFLTLCIINPLAATAVGHVAPEVEDSVKYPAASTVPKT